MFNEKNIPKFISFLPPLGIIFVTVIFILLIVKNDYDQLDFENTQIKESYIQEETQSLKNSINDVILYKQFLENKQETLNQKLLQQDVINFIKDVLSKNHNYIFIIDDKANIIYHPFIQTGTNTWDIIDRQGLKLTQAFIQKAKIHEQGSFHTYLWNKPEESQGKKKTAFVYYLKQWNWVLDTGTYLDDVEAQIIQNTYVLNQKMTENVSYTILLSIVLTLITLIISFFFSKIINKIFASYKKDAIFKEKKLKKLNRSLTKLANEEIQKRSLKEKELEYAHIERLTGLPNRLKLSEILEDAKSAKLAILNIDRFIDINNFYSPHLSDLLLKEIAILLVDSFKNKKDVSIFKLPVDEYAIFTNSQLISDFEFTNICQLAIRLIERKPFLIKNNEILVSITAGISLSCENTYINADTALKIAKDKHKNLFVYNKNDNVELNFQNNIKWTKILKTAVNEHRIVVFKQPIVCNKDSSIKKYECLIRIKQDDGTFITPFHFLDIAKKIKIYPKLTKIVVSQAFKHFSKNDSEFSINLTLDDITNKDTVRYITHKLEKYN
ncbi:MAG: cache domain-containing protein, partial [Campylobacteraceae bacterium]|nr:cache domain-containing protein [Campylobacteraceae bacterium]